MKHRNLPVSIAVTRVPARGVKGGFTLIELLVAIGVISVLVALLLPALGSTKETARSAQCLSNLRQISIIIHAYANDHQGLTPALGVPWTEPPFWALSVQSAARDSDGASGAVYQTDSVLVCPSCSVAYGRDMGRTYAMNATGHSGLSGDRQNYDSEPAHVRLHRVSSPSSRALCVDSAIAPINGIAPPSTRTASVIDFRIESHVQLRIGYFHGGRARFNACLVDCSARTFDSVPPGWLARLP